VVLPCYVDELLLMEGLEVEWRRTDSQTLVHLFLDGESRPEAQQQDYHDRAHFFTDQIQHGNFSLHASDEQYRDRVEFFTAEIPKGNFSLRLKSVRTEDKGVYMCLVFAGDLSANATVVLEQLVAIFINSVHKSFEYTVCCGHCMNSICHYLFAFGVNEVFLWSFIQTSVCSLPSCFGALLKVSAVV
uniref:Ig-like domain-containing protein n=1 Tax=Sinocyclocheilus grahami TaxID=75366 RepID=A0A672RNN0_SINGR